MRKVSPVPIDIFGHQIDRVDRVAVATIQITSSVETEDDEMMAPIRHKR